MSKMHYFSNNLIRNPAVKFDF